MRKTIAVSIGMAFMPLLISAQQVLFGDVTVKWLDWQLKRKNW